MTDIADFLLARIAEDEAAAGIDAPLQAAMAAAWPGLPNGLSLAEAERRTVAALSAVGIPDPARVLAECEAKRRIVELADRDDDWRYGMHSEAIQVVLRLLALPYADHPDYDAGWRP